MENKQTAVEWLFQQLWDEPKDKFTWYALREKALQMEKEQLENARPQIVSNCVIKEISDEEYYKDVFYQKQVMNPYPTGDQSYTAYEKGFMDFAKWYREQLKKKQL